MTEPRHIGSEMEELIRKVALQQALKVAEDVGSYSGCQESLERILRESGLLRLLEAMTNVPDPEQEGYCQSCGDRLELIKIGDAYKWKHLPHCWYGELRAALAAIRENLE